MDKVGARTFPSFHPTKPGETANAARHRDGVKEAACILIFHDCNLQLPLITAFQYALHPSTTRCSIPKSPRPSKLGGKSTWKTPLRCIIACTRQANSAPEPPLYLSRPTRRSRARSPRLNTLFTSISVGLHTDLDMGAMCHVYRNTVLGEHRQTDICCE